jgi:hypothetical protein
MDTVKFTKKEVKNYLDSVIIFWRKQRDDKITRGIDNQQEVCYIDAYQSVRVSLFGEMLPIDETVQE